MHRKILVAATVVIAILGFGLLIAPKLGWATPFALPHHVSFHGRTYWDGDANVPEHFPCTTKLVHGYRPLQPAGAVFGYLTGDPQILLPHYEWADPHPFVLFVRNGGCLQQYVDIQHEG